MAERKVTFLINANAKNFIKGVDNATKKFKRFGRDMKDMGQSLSRNVSLPIAALGGLAVKTAGDFEKLRTSMDVLNGSVEEGARNFERLKRFSARTPFQLQDLASAQNMLQGFGLAADDAFNSLSMIGDIAAVSGGDIKGIGIAFGQAAAEGRLMTRDIRQLINQGVPAIKLLADTMNVAQSEVLDLASEGKISFDILVRSFQQATQEGGMFADGMQKQSKTILGLFSTLKDNVSIAMGEIGTSIVDALDLRDLMESVINRIRSLVESFKQLSDDAKKRMVLITAAIAGIGPALVAVGTTVVAFGAIIAGLTSPVTLVIGAIGGIVLAFEYVRRNLDVFVNRFEIAFTELKNSIIQEVADMQTSFLSLFESLPGVNTLAITQAKAAVLSLQDPVEEVKGEFQSMGEFAKSIGRDLVNQFQKLSGLNLSEMIDTNVEGGGEITGPTVSGGGFGQTIGRGMDVIGASLPRPQRLHEIASGFTQVWTASKKIPAKMKEMSQASQVAMDIANDFTNSFGAGMANVVVQGEKLVDVLKNIGKLLLSSAIQKGISLFLTGGLSGSGFFGSGGGLFGKIFGVNDALITSGGDVVKFHPDDNILAMKDFGNLGGGGGVIENRIYLDGREVARSLKNIENRRR